MSITPKSKKIVNNIFFITIIIIAIVFTLFPIFYAIETSLKMNIDIFTIKTKFLFKPDLGHWKYVLTSDFIKFYKNSIIVAIFADIIVIFAGSFTGYALAKFKIRKKKDIAFWILSQGMLPPIAILLPIYILYSNLRIIDTYIGIILIFSAFNLPLAVWLFRNFFDKIPSSLEEAAFIDGANRFGVFFRINIPLVIPGIIVIAVYTFVMCVNEFFFALILTGKKTRTAAAAITNFLPSTTKQLMYGEAAAASLLVMFPALLIFIFLQRYFIAGATLGAVKE